MGGGKVKNKKWFFRIIAIIVVFIMTVIWINYTYVYFPINYPKGLISEYHYSFLDFKKPIFIEGIYDKENGERWFSRYITDEETVKNILKHFDEAVELKNFNEDMELPKTRLSQYEVIIRSVDSWEGGGSRAYGTILIQFQFYEEKNFFFIGNRYFELSDDLKTEIMDAFSEVEWYQW